MSAAQSDDTKRHDGGRDYGVERADDTETHHGECSDVVKKVARVDFLFL